MRRRDLLIGTGAILTSGTMNSGPLSAANDSARDVDIEELAAIRPGMPVTQLQAAMGRSWREPMPHKGGNIDVLENSHGFLAQIDVDGRVGNVTYTYRFPSNASIDGLRMGMRLDEALRAKPKLEIHDRPLMKGVKDGRISMSGDINLWATFTLSTINRVEIINRAAKYHKMTAPTYPAAAGEAGAPFNDVNLKLVILSSLLDAKLIDLGTPEYLAAHVLGRKVDINKEGYRLIPAAYDYLARFPLDGKVLNLVEKVVFDGGNSIYPYAWNFWDGEDDIFNVRNLDRIENAPNIRIFQSTSMISHIDFRRLASLKQLETISIGTSFSNLNALLDMPNLRNVEILGNSAYHDVNLPGSNTRNTVESLKKRGVTVWIHWMSHDGLGRPEPYE